MKTIAVLSAILLPLTLIAGIYGMNFKNMPELESQNGYYYTLGFMAVLTIILLVYFYRRGWIFQSDEELRIKKPVLVHDNDEDGNGGEES